MPIKTDAAGKRWVEMELLVPGTPEQVWQAMATGPGSTGWFVSTEIEPRVGGELRLDFGDGAVAKGEVTQWEPPRALAYVERNWAEGAPSIATEITVTGRSGGRCVVRMVHSLFATSDDWDDQMEGFESGWPGFFAVLRVYLAHFAGARAASFMKMTPASGDSLSVWRRLGEALGLAGASVGERRTASPGPEAWAGVVELVHQDAQQRYVLVRQDAPSPGIVLVGTYDKGATSHDAAGQGTSVSVCRYYYGEDAETRRAEGEPRWREWLAATFGVEDPGSAGA
jgi:uncharacterized protein YndB with AHSA1/START domain